MKVGIISFAHIHARSYARALQEIDGAMLAGIADDDEARGRAAATQFNTMFYSSYMD